MMTDYPAPRRIAYLVIHCTATRASHPFPLEALRRCHVQQRGFRDIGYHFYITRDGITHPCRPLDQVGAHVFGFNQHSVGICYEGGLDEEGRPADTRTNEQKIALTALLRELRKDYPEARIVGHYELSTSIHKACPCFRASEEYKEL